MTGQHSRRTDHAIVSDCRQHLSALRSRYPSATDLYASFRKGRGSPQLGTWPDWCYVPMAGAVAVVSDGDPGGARSALALEIGRVAAVASWRLGQGVYRLDADLYQRLADTALPDDAPLASLYRLPEWCVYLDLSGDADAQGAYAHLEFDINTKRPELRLLFDTGHGWDGLLAVALFLDEPSLATVRHGPLPAELGEVIGKMSRVDLMLNALLYLTSGRAQITSTTGEAGAPRRVETAVREPRVWEVR